MDPKEAAKLKEDIQRAFAQLYREKQSAAIKEGLRKRKCRLQMAARLKDAD